MREYTVTITAPGSDTPDIVTFNSAIVAIEAIQDNRRLGNTVTYTGDPFAVIGEMED
jgi:hypothetical protein